MTTAAAATKAERSVAVDGAVEASMVKTKKPSSGGNVLVDDASTAAPIVAADDRALSPGDAGRSPSTNEPTASELLGDVNHQWRRFLESVYADVEEQQYIAAVKENLKPKHVQFECGLKRGLCDARIDGVLKRPSGVSAVSAGDDSASFEAQLEQVLDG